MTFMNFDQSTLKNSTLAQAPAKVYLEQRSDLISALDALPHSQARRVKVPTSEAKSRAFMAKLANSNAARIAAGGVAMVLVLMHADSAAAQAQGGNLPVGAIDGVASVTVQADGSALVTLDSGATLTLPAGSFVQTASGDILVAQGTATQIAAAAESAAAAGAGVGAAAVAVPVAALGALAAGGGGGGSSQGNTPSEPSTSSGIVIDGYLVNATVFRDINDNGTLESSEPNTQTDAGGNWTLEIDPGNANAKLISFGGIDSSTGKAFTGVLTAPGASTVVTPLTTLVQSYVEAQATAGTPVDAATAASSLAKALGLEGADILTLDPIALIESDSGSASAYQAAAQVASVINAAAASSAGDGAAESEAVAASLAEQLIAKEAEAPGSGASSLSDSAVIQSALAAGGVSGESAAKIVEEVGKANTLIANAGNGENVTPADIQNQIAKVQEVVQGDLVNAIKNDDGSLADLNVTGNVDALVTLRPTVTDATATFGPTALADGLDVSGTGRPQSLIKVSIDGVDETTTVDKDGNWTVSFAQADLPDADGDFAIQVRAQATGSEVFTTPVSGGTLTVDLTAPSLSFSDLPTEAVSLLAQLDGVTIAGKADAGSTVAVTLNGVEKDASVDAEGNFTATFDGAVNVGQTRFALSAVAEDANGNTSAPVTAEIAVQPLSALTPTVDALPAAINADGADEGVTLLGTGLAGSVVAITLAPSGSGAALTDTATVTPGGIWTYTITSNSPLLAADGGFAVSVVATLADGAISSGAVAGGSSVVDVTAPAAATDVLVSTDNILALEERSGSFDVTGKAESDSSVAIKVGDVTKTVVADATGAFSVSFDATDLPLAAASASVQTTVTDAAGNAGAPTQTTVAIEPLSALNPVINAVDQTIGQAGLNNGLSISGTGRAGSTVTVTLEGVAKTAAVDGSNDWTVHFATADLPTASGSFNVTYSAALTAGTTLLETAMLPGGTLTVDLTVSDGPLISAIAGDDVLDAKEIRSDLEITGTAEAGTTVTVTLSDLVATDDVGEDGLFSVSFSAEEIADLPVNASVSAFSTDALENVSGISSRAFTVTPPIVGTVNVDTLSGTAGNDVFILKTEGSTAGSAGDDEYDFTDPDIEYQGVSYANLTQAIDAQIDMRGGATSTVSKGPAGTDTLLDVAKTGDFGFDIVTTAQDDTVFVQQNTEEYGFTGVLYEGGNDTIDVNIGLGTTRISFGGNDAVNVDLAQGSATVLREDAANSEIEININTAEGANTDGQIEVRGSSKADTLVGSDLNDRFIGGGGNDTIDGGEGRDLVRFDRNEVGEGVFIELTGELGQALGVWNGESFRQTLYDVEDARGSAGNDLIVANANGSSIRGNDGNDTLIGDIGNDMFIGGAGADVFQVGEGFDYINDFVIGQDVVAVSDVVFPEIYDGVFTFEDTQEGLAVMSNSKMSGNTTFGGGVTAAQLQAAFDDGILLYAPAMLTNDITGTAADDVLTGTDANDFIKVVGREDGTFGEDVIFGSQGEDRFDLSDLGETDYVEFNYSTYQGNGIVSEFSFDGGPFGSGSNGVVLKIGEAFDRINGLDAAGDGVGLIGTAQNDSFFVVYNDMYYHWVGYKHTGGDDIVSIEKGRDADYVNGIFRLSIGDDGNDVTADLNEGYLSSAAGSITITDGDGSTGQFSRPVWEVHTYDGDDNVKGTDINDRFILGGGQDTVDGRGGSDLVRYDRSEISGGVTVDLGQGTATGTWNGETFNHTLISIEEVRASAGDDVLIGTNGDDFLDGRAGDDTLTGGGGADIFVISDGHDVILDFDLDNDEFEDRGIDRGEASFAEIQFEGVTSLKVNFEGDSDTSLTLKGVDLAGFEQWLIAQEFGDKVTPAGLDDPMIVEFFGAGLFGEDPLEDVGLVSATSTEIVLSKATDTGSLVSKFTGTGFTFFGELPTGGQLETFDVTIDGVPALNVENINYPLVDFVDELENDGIIARDAIVKGTAGSDELGFPAQNVWIEAGDGNDTLVGVNGSSVGMAPGAGSDTIVIEQINGFDQNFIFIDPADAGVDNVSFFRLTNQSDTGDSFVFAGGEDSRSHYEFFQNDLGDLTALNGAVAGWGGFMGEDMNIALFTDNSGNGVLYTLDTSGGTPALGDKVADLTGINTVAWDTSQDGAFDHIINFVDELPQLPEVA